MVFEPQTSKDRDASPSPRAGHSLNAFSTPFEARQQPHSFYSPRMPQSSGMNSAPETILIAVFGMTGTGKTTLVKNLAGNAAKNLRTGHGLMSCKIARTLELGIDSH